MSDTRTRILDVGEELIRTRGYTGFAFREIATAVGIKSASVHYHFPTKSDLLMAAMDRYSDKFLSVLNQIDAECDNAAQKMERLFDFYRLALREDRAVTFCMTVGHERANMPEEATDALALLISNILSWIALLVKELQPELSNQAARAKAIFIHSALQGGILGTSAIGSTEYFSSVINGLKSNEAVFDI